MVIQQTGIDPITYEVIKNKLRAIIADQTIAIQHISGSPIVTEATDYNNGLYMADGTSLEIGLRYTPHAQSLSLMVEATVRECTENPGINEDDQFFCNDPWRGAIHQSDVGMVAPIFYKGEMVAWSGALAHQIDVGGGEFGSWVPWATEVYQEGVPIPPIRLVEGGRVRQDLWNMLMAHTRLPFLVSLDLKAFIGANNVAKRRFVELADRYGMGTLKAVMDEIVAEGDRRVRERIKEFPDGTYRAAVYWDHCGLENTLQKTMVSVTKEEDRLIVDFTGTDPQSRGFINNALPATLGATGSQVLANLGWDLPWNGGVYKALEIIAPPGTLVNAQFPAPVSGSPCTEQFITCAVLHVALSRMLGCVARYREEVTAVPKYSFPTLNAGGLNQYGEPFGTMFLDGMAGGEGACSWRDGASAHGQIGVPAPNIADVETNENFGPYLYLYRKIYTDSGGAGRWKGGETAGLAIALHDANFLQCVLVGHGPEAPQEGFYGGMPGGCGRNMLVKGSDILERFQRGETVTSIEELKGEAKDLGAKPGAFPFAPGDVLENRYQAAGGYGDPLEREPERVLRDVADGTVSLQAARDLYGVVIRLGKLELDAEATSRERKRVLEERLIRAKGVPRVPQMDASRARKLMPMGEYLEVVQVDGDKLIRCRCGYQLGPVTRNWKESTLMETMPEAEAGPMVKLHGDLEMRRYVCPECGLLHCVELLRKGEAPLWEVELKM